MGVGVSLSLYCKDKGGKYTSSNVPWLIIEFNTNVFIQHQLTIAVTKCPFISHGSCSPEAHIDFLKKF